MTGHIPKLYLSQTRYVLWRQLRNLPDVTTYSNSLNCSIGAYSACQRRSYWASRSVTEISRFCFDSCPSANTCGISITQSKAEALTALWKVCTSYMKIDYASERADMARDTRPLSHPQYLEHAMSHRFCLIALSDHPSTPKIAEAMAIGGVGGCIPVFVLPIRSSTVKSSRRSRLARAVAQTLPYSRWLDYCKVSYLVLATKAERDISSVIAKLRQVTKAEVRAARAACW